MTSLPGGSSPIDGTAPDMPLSAHHIELTARASRTIRLGGFKGSALRGALASSLRRSYCPESRSGQADPLHRSVCPVCQLLSWEADNAEHGDLRRPYALTPPLDGKEAYEQGEEFTFGLTLFGDSLVYQPFLILAAQDMGRTGLGRKNRSGARGQFDLTRIRAVNPLTQEQRTLYAEGDRQVRNSMLPVTHEHVAAASDALLPRLRAGGNRLHIRFLTPMRLVYGKGVAKAPAFFPLIKQTVLRVLDLCAQHGGGRPDIALRRDIYPHADRVDLVSDDTRWWDVHGYSSRLQRSQVLGGFVGSATYASSDWEPLLPWLIWGESVRAGKNIVKGCGIFRVDRYLPAAGTLAAGKEMNHGDRP